MKKSLGLKLSLLGVASAAALAMNSNATARTTRVRTAHGCDVHGGKTLPPTEFSDFALASLPLIVAQAETQGLQTVNGSSTYRSSGGVRIRIHSDNQVCNLEAQDYDASGRLVARVVADTSNAIAASLKDKVAYVWLEHVGADSSKWRYVFVFEPSGTRISVPIDPVLENAVVWPAFCDKSTSVHFPGCWQSVTATGKFEGLILAGIVHGYFVPTAGIQ